VLRIPLDPIIQMERQEAMSEGEAPAIPDWYPAGGAFLVYKDRLSRAVIPEAAPTKVAQLERRARIPVPAV
jgi:hypothetical protein